MQPGRLLCLTSREKVALLAVMQSDDGSADPHRQSLQNSVGQY